MKMARLKKSMKLKVMFLMPKFNRKNKINYLLNFIDLVKNNNWLFLKKKFSLKI